MSSQRCAHHPDVILPDKFAFCLRCAQEFFERHQIRSDVFDSGVLIVGLEDIITEMEDILQKEVPCSSSSSSSFSSP